MNLKSNFLLTKVPLWNVGSVKADYQHLKGQERYGSVWDEIAYKSCANH